MKESLVAKPIHRRTVEHQSRLLDGDLLELESRLIDSKGYDTEVGFGRQLSAGEPVHDMTIRLLLGPDGVIREIELKMDSAPFEICPEVTQRFEILRGASIGKGWNAMLSGLFNGIGGCRHLVDLLRGMATVAFQSRPPTEWTPAVLDAMANTCHAFRVDGPVMARLKSADD